jgi:hypothetical protein
MERDEAMEQLTAQLRDVTLRLAQLEAAADRRGDSVSSASTTAAPVDEEDVASSAKKAAAPIPQKGDRVYITNAVNKPKFWNGSWEQGKAQKATVTHFYNGQIHFVTDNGIRTW